MSDEPNKEKNYLKLLVISDIVEDVIYSPALTRNFNDIDLVLSCGDLPLYYLEYIVTLLNVPLGYVRGNHGKEVEYTSYNGAITEPGGCTNLDNRVGKIKGLLIGGLEGSMRYNWSSDFQYNNWQMRLKVLRMIPLLHFNRIVYGRYLDILITHAPPYKIHDQNDLCHTGFKVFRTFMDMFKPRYLFHGHIHLYNRNATWRTWYKQTEVINAYGHRVIEIEMPFDKPRSLKKQ